MHPLRKDIFDAPEGLQPHLLRENLEVIRRTAKHATKEQRKEAFAALSTTLSQGGPWMT